MATNFEKLSQEAFDASSAYVEANWRSDWDYSLRAFRNEHASNSKYNSPEYAHRSRLFRPKTRSAIRKTEAAAAMALFSNMEVVDLQPEDQSNLIAVAGRDAMKAVLEYRLGKTIPTFEICIGGVQDAQVQGVVCSYQYWEYETRNGRKTKDKPCIDLRPIENIRLDGGASWLDPVNSSPYFCDILPMYVCDVQAMMNNEDTKTGQPKWKKYGEKEILKAKPDTVNSMRQARLGDKQEPSEERPNISAFDIVWVMRWFMRDSQGVDHTYYTLGPDQLLTKPMYLEDVYFHGLRPYEMGYAILETHKPIKTSLPTLVRPLQQEGNAVANDRLDNVKLVLHKRYYVARGRQVDVNSLVRGAAGAVTLMTDPKTDVVEGQWNDVTSSAYVEQDRISGDFDELAGNFSPNTPLANKGARDTLGGNRQASQSAGLMTDYTLRTIIETWWEKVLRQLIKLEAYYETDEAVLALAAKNAQLFPRYGISQVTDEMLNSEMTLTVNVGMGATNPNERFTKLIGGTQAVMQTIMTAPPNFNVQEFVKEAYSNMGYRDGSRFWANQADPRLAKAMQMIQQLTAQLQGKQGELQAQGQIEQMKLQSAERTKAAELQVDYFRISGDLKIREAELEVEKARLQLEWAQAQIELKGASDQLQLKVIEAQKKLEEAEIKLQGEIVKVQAAQQEAAASVEQAHLKVEEARMKHDNEKKIGMMADRVEPRFAALESRLEAKDAESKANRDADRLRLEQHGQALALIIGGLQENRNKKKPTGFTIKKKDGKKSLVVEFSDGSEEEMPVKAA